MLGLLSGLNPLRIGIALLVISRPRPIQNLIAYGLGCLTACIVAVSVPLTLLHVTPMFEPLVDDFFTSPIVRYIQIGLGVLALFIAALLVTNSLIRKRQPAELPPTGGNGPAPAATLPVPQSISRLYSRAQAAPAESDSAFRRLLRRIHDGWKNGSLWIAFAIGIGFGGIEPDAGLLLLAFIVTSGAEIGAQIAAGIAFIIGINVVVEITLISCLIAPTKTQATLQRLHDWALSHHRKILIAMCLIGGVALILRGVVTG